MKKKAKLTYSEARSALLSLYEVPAFMSGERMDCFVMDVSDVNATLFFDAELYSKEDVEKKLSLWKGSHEVVGGHVEIGGMTSKWIEVTLFGNVGEVGEKEESE